MLLCHSWIRRFRRDDGQHHLDESKAAFWMMINPSPIGSMYGIFTYMKAIEIN